MNVSGKITKTELLLIALTALFLALAALLAPGTDRIQADGGYSVTVSRRTSEPVTPEAPAPVNINTATADELETLSGIGPVTARRIIEYREAHGPFASVEELLKVDGIGKATLDAFRAHVTIGSYQYSGGKSE